MTKLNISVILGLAVIVALLIVGIKNQAVVDWFGGESVFPQIILTVITLFYVALTAMMLAQMNRAHHADTRPYVSIDLVIENHRVWVRAYNYGRSSARNVKVRFEPDITLKTTKTLNESVFKDVISYFPPQKEIRCFINQSPEFLRSSNETYRVKCEYTDAQNKKVIKESHTISVSYASAVLFLTECDLTDIYKQIEAISQTLKALSSNTLRIANKACEKDDKEGN